MKILMEPVKGSDLTKKFEKLSIFVNMIVKILMEPVKGSERRRAEPEDKSDLILI